MQFTIAIPDHHDRVKHARAIRYVEELQRKFARIGLGEVAEAKTTKKATTKKKAANK